MARKAKRQSYTIGPGDHPCIILPGLAIGYFLGVALCVAAFPVTLPWAAWKFSGEFKEDREESREYQIRLGQRRSTSPPRGMSRSRRKTMHLGRRRKTRSPETPALQEDSILLCLPPELRHLIWKECLAGSTLHLNSQGHTRCTSTNPGLCNQVVYTAAREYFTGSDVNPISLFLTCRQIYLEAADHFYSGNNFTTNIADNIEFMPRLLLRSRIDTIRSLRFIWTILGDPPFPLFDWNKIDKPRPAGSKNGIRFKRKMWVTTWANLAGMSSLRDLRVTLEVERYKWWSMENWEEVAVLEPLMSVTTPEFFELTVPMARKADDGPWDALPCVVRREKMAMVNTFCLKFDGPDLNEAN